jgi:SEC-C motif domain protein
VNSLPAVLDKPQTGQPCPCGTGKRFEDCCGPLLQGLRKAGTAEELMRSRFTAHVANDELYLHRTYRGTARLPFVPEKAGGALPQWTRLTVHAHETGANPDLSLVDFSAFFRDEKGEGAIQEKAEFVRASGEWLYTRAVRSGPAPFKSSAPKAGRNDPCPCGSGKKYKHCCLAKA